MLKENPWFLYALDCYQGLKYEWKKRNNKGVAKPQVINFNANDICNSKCTMCNIWKQKKDTEITPAEFSKILSNPLFQEVKHIGITGGEPTLREDLPELYEAACQTLPNLRGMSAITNAIKPKDVIERLEASEKVCHQYGKSFSLMVSLDGYGSTHDKIRGREGNFDTAVQVIQHFKQKGTPIGIGCTITKDNLWHVDELLDFLIENNIYGRFRVAEFINRLYNNDLTGKIRNFTDDELYNLALFFKKLELTFEKNPTYIRTYQSIRNMLLGGKRLIGCPYHSKGAVLDTRGNIAYCAPKSPIIGNALQSDATAIFEENTAIRDKIISTDCDNCIHDYHAPASIPEQKRLVERIFWKNMVLKFPQIPAGWLTSKSTAPKKADEYRVLITGWYGTETVGDKAILGGIIQHYQKHFSNATFQVTSMYPFITHRTLQELNIEAETIPVYSQHFFNSCASAHEIVMGGGPLMGIQALNVPLRAFQLGKKYKAKNVIFGCGIGPVNGYEDKILKILRMADEIKLRDQKSADWVKQNLTHKKTIKVINDPAYEYVEYQKSQTNPEEKQAELACFLREWPREYAADQDDESFNEQSERFEQHLANTIKGICNQLNLKPVFYSMHNFTVGNDDRDFYRKFTRKYFEKENYEIKLNPASVKSTVEAMLRAKYCLSMRFHSVLFAHVLKTNYFAIDYTNGGKIKNFLSERDQENRMIELQKFHTTDANLIIEQLEKSQV